MYTIELTETEHKNLLEFLKRVQLNGVEAPTFVLLIQKISTAIPKNE